MTKKIFRSVFAAVLLVLLASVVVILAALYGYFTSVQSRQLEVQTAFAAQGVEQDGLDYLSGLNTEGYRITWVAADGTVIYDNMADADTMENHAGREEVREALEKGSGESVRYSSTMSEKTLYRAQRLTDGSVLRTSITQYTALSLASGMLQPVVLILVGAILLSALLARRLSRKIVGPLNELNLDSPLENDAYEELSPLLTRIEQQHRQINKQLDELKRRQEEFIAVIGNMSEGFILLNDKGIILSINRAAMQLFGSDESCIGRDMLLVDRSLAIQELLNTALQGRHGETTVGRNGREYQLNASPINSGTRVTGMVLLMFDVTEKAFAERRRREFSANVSHELKTPLHSIMGSAELIDNGLVKPEDMPRFIKNIRTEAGRLVNLIDDIIRLSQLDEGVEMPREDVNLREIAKDAMEALSAEAGERGVVLALSGENTVIRGVRRLLYEIAYNLCDNAIKYNVKGGRVDITVKRDGADAVLTVADTGIGIPPEHQQRVFERFYRVDKSHSRSTGGTGLGLSIVKHAAQYHGAAIEIESGVGKGTTIRVRFPLEQ